MQVPAEKDDAVAVILNQYSINNKRQFSAEHIVTENGGPEERTPCQPLIGLVGRPNARWSELVITVVTVQLKNIHYIRRSYEV